MCILNRQGPEKQGHLYEPWRGEIVTMMELEFHALAVYLRLAAWGISLISTLRTAGDRSKSQTERQMDWTSLIQTSIFHLWEWAWKTLLTIKHLTSHPDNKWSRSSDEDFHALRRVLQFLMQQTVENWNIGKEHLSLELSLWTASQKQHPVWQV